MNIRRILKRVGDAIDVVCPWRFSACWALSIVLAVKVAEQLPSNLIPAAIIALLGCGFGFWWEIKAWTRHRLGYPQIAASQRLLN